jgi:hypothetical protein
MIAPAAPKLQCQRVATSAFYPASGSRRSAQVQIGNAVPARLAEQVSRALSA